MQMPIELAAAYRSPAQRARVVSEAWGEENLFCPRCPSSRLTILPPNTQSIDFTCPRCQSPFQLKCQSHPVSHRLTDSAYGAMVSAIKHDRTPNFFVLHYDRSRWEVQNLILIPRFAVSLSCIEKRRPLSPKARRHGWVGCNIVISNIPTDARIAVVTGGISLSPSLVREQYARLQPLQELRHEARGWTLDVLRFLRCIGREEFSLGDIYAFHDDLQLLHPDNRHIKEKIRQQMQRLRDLELLDFLGHGTYRLKQPMGQPLLMASC
jgi:type II restriction enzyme